AQETRIIVARAFANPVACEIHLGEIAERHLINLILAPLRRILSLGNRADLDGRELSGLLDRERAVRADREAPHAPPNPLFEDETFPPFRDAERKPRELVIAHKPLPVGWKGRRIDQTFREERHRGIPK